MTIGDTTAKLSVNKKNIEVREDQSDCDKPVYRAKAISRTFDECIVVFFRDRAKIRTLLVLSNPLRTYKALRIWTQYYGIEQLMLNFNLWKKRSPHPTRHQQQYTGHSVPKRGL